MNAALLLRMMLRQARGSRGRLLFFCACIAVGVAAVVGVDALVNAIETGLRVRSRELLGGDLAIESRRPLPDIDAYVPRALRGALRRADLTILPTMVQKMVQNQRGQSHLAEVTAIAPVRGAFPLVGALGLRPDRPLSELLDDRSTVITPELAHDLDLRVGDDVRIGGAQFAVRAVVEARPDRLELSFAIGPELLLTRGGLERAALLGFGDRVRYRALLAWPKPAPDSELAQVRRTLLAAIPGAGTFVTVETHEEAQPALRNTLTLARRYLGLVALLSLLLGCVGVAQIASTWIAQNVQSTAVLRCLGFRPRDVLIFHLGHVLLMSIAGSLAGGLLGLSLPVWVARAHPGLFAQPTALALDWVALARGVGLGASVALLFCLPPLTAVWKVSPARVLRNEVEPLPLPRSVRVPAFAASALAVFLAAWAQADDARQAVLFACGVSALVGALWLGARGLQRAMSRLPRERVPALLWQGAAALVRPGAGTTGSIVALGLGTLVVLGIALVRDIVGEEVSAALPEDAPSVFLADVQPDQWPGIEALAHDFHARNVRSSRVVTARVASVNGRPVAELVRERAHGPAEQRRANWVFTREQRVSFEPKLPEHNTLIAGRLWARPGVPELSIEQSYARDLGVGLGGRLALDVQGVVIDFVVTSLREIEWRSFSPNFFLLAEPGYLDDAPQFRIAALRVDAQAEQKLQNAIVARFPNVTVIRVRSMLERAQAILDQVAVGVQLLGSFAVLTGLVILVGAVAATQLRRAREAALLKTLGVTRARVAAMFAVEYALRGVVAGVLGVAGAYALAYAFTSQVLQLSKSPSPVLCAAAVLGVTLLSIVGGLLASLRALQVPPLAVLRADSW